MRALMLLLLVPAFAGCLTETADEVVLEPDERIGLVTGALPSGEVARDFIESYIMTHPYRVEGPATQSFMDTARVDLQAELEGMGLFVDAQAYDGGVNILGIQNGTTHPEQWVVLSAHYDTIGAGVGTTVYGAWDDGAGVATLLGLADAFQDWEFPFTVVYAFFDGEEKGLVGSTEFANTYAPQEQDAVDIIANINTDPPGLNWPCGDVGGPFPVKVIHNDEKADSGEHPRYAWLREAIASGLNESGVPTEVVDFSPGIPIATVAGTGLRGGSDHLSFDRLDIANVYLGGIPTTYVNGGPEDGGTAAALTYPLHTPLDTLEAMEARCVEGSLAGGLQTISDVFANTLVHMAGHPAP